MATGGGRNGKRSRPLSDSFELRLRTEQLRFGIFYNIITS